MGSVNLHSCYGDSASLALYNVVHAMPCKVEATEICILYLFPTRLFHALLCSLVGCLCQQCSLRCISKATFGGWCSRHVAHITDKEVVSPRIWPWEADLVVVVGDTTTVLVACVAVLRRRDEKTAKHGAAFCTILHFDLCPDRDDWATSELLGILGALSVVPVHQLELLAIDEHLEHSLASTFVFTLFVGWAIGRLGSGEDQCEMSPCALLECSLLHLKVRIIERMEILLTRCSSEGKDEEALFKFRIEASKTRSEERVGSPATVSHVLTKGKLRGRLHTHPVLE